MIATSTKPDFQNNYMVSMLFKQALRARALLALAAVYPSFLLAQPAPTASPVDIEAAKREAEAWAYGMQGGPQLDATGNVLLNEDGSIRMGPASSEQAQNQQALLQQLTGLSDYKALADPAANKDMAGASAQISGQVDFSCTLRPGTTKAAAGYEIRFGGCRLENGTVTAVALQLCSNLLNGELCRDPDFTDLDFYPVGTYSQIGGATVGIGCNEERVCRVSLNGSFSLVSSGHTLRERAEERGSGSELRASMQDILGSQEYAQAVQDQLDIRDCYASNEASFLNEGEVTTCDGQTRVALAGGPATAASCTPERVCTEQITTTQTFTTSCTRTFGSLTTNRCTLQYKTLQCVNYDGWEIIPREYWTNDCREHDLEGATEVSRETYVCHLWLRLPLLGTQCFLWGADTSYVFLDEYEYTDCEAYPSPLAGQFGPDICDMSAPGREILSCGAGGWFGRTLPDNQCQETVTRDDGSTYVRFLDATEKPGCGMCTQAARVGFTCQALPTAEDLVGSCATIDLTGCALTGVDSMVYEGSIPLSQREYYSCTRETTMCTSWQTVGGSCPNIDASYGVDQMPFDEVGDQDTFQQAMGVAGVASELATAAASGTEANPLLFGGVAMTCEKPAGGFLSDAAQNDCCKLGLTKTGGSHIGNKCNDTEVKLAAARRNNFVHYVGSYCSKDTLFGKCIRRAEVYCVFDGLLPRIVQEQGRLQLAEAANIGSGSAQTRTMSFAYYSGSGGWTSPITVNDRQVAVFQEPSYCQDPRTAAQTMAQDATARACSASLGLWFAACNDAGTCGELPRDPESGSAGWQIVQVDPLKATDSPLTRYISVRGACNTETGACNYTVSALPQGIAGRAVITEDLSFSIHSASIGGSYDTMVGGRIETVQDGVHTAVVGRTMIRVTPPLNVALGELPANIPAAISFDGGGTWAPFQLPTTIATEFAIPSANITATGGCIKATGQCTYRFTGTAKLQPKPWGGPGNPDCSGFTLEELAALDFSKMDLSEWTQTLDDDLPSAEDLNAWARALAAQAEGQAGRTNASRTSDPSGRVAVVKPSQGIGPFTVRLTVSQTWPTLGNEVIYGGQVDWGDGSPAQNLIASQNGFYRDHTYPSPETPGIRDRLGRTGPFNSTIEHVVTVTLNTESGTRIVTLDVRNVF